MLKIPEGFYSGKKFLILGNLPYNISTKVLSTWCLSENLKVSKMILMFQKEVADRITADVNSRDYSRITILSNWKFDVKKIIDVSNSFFQKPKSIVLFEFTIRKKFTQ